MSTPLSTYLHDHLAGANFAVDLLQGLADLHKGNPLGEFVTQLKSEIEQDRQVLIALIETTGFTRPTVKEATAWLAEKASRFKLAWSSDKEAGTFQALEVISLGILGKLALWDALAVVPAGDSLDLALLRDRARSQHDGAERWRLKTATVLK